MLDALDAILFNFNADQHSYLKNIQLEICKILYNYLLYLVGTLISLLIEK